MKFKKKKVTEVRIELPRTAYSGSSVNHQTSHHERLWESNPDLSLNHFNIIIKFSFHKEVLSDSQHSIGLA